ncbi:MAG: hypothetical protein IKP64_12480 [Selenomonadaceae bacterium]|nr:hypothetical protein [Selenomonadaceae bacterium]
MTKKFFLMCLAILLAFHGAAAAKKAEIPEEDRIRIAIEVVDGTRHKDFNTATMLENYLATRLVEKKIVNVVGEDSSDNTADELSGVENLGELLIFDAVELPTTVETPADFNQQAYQNLGAAYVVRCEVLALGLTKVEDETIGTISSIVGGGLALGGSGNKSSDKTLRRVGSTIGLLGLGGVFLTKRTALNTVVNMQFIDVETGRVLWQENFVGQAVKHHKGGKNFDDPWTRALHESVDDSAKSISKRVNKYVDNVLINGKSDKNFLPKKNIFKLNKGKLF